MSIRLIYLLATLIIAAVLSACGTLETEVPGLATEAVAVTEATTCQTLYAGQNIDAGTVCFEVVGEDLVVTYTTTGGWELVETHAWAGDVYADMPQSRNGNPKIGNFPYASGDITGVTSFSFHIPLVTLFGQNYQEADICDNSVFVAAHASVRKDDGNGGYQTETGWGYGDRMVQRGSWATFSTITFECTNGEDPEEKPAGCETAFAFAGSGEGEVAGMTLIEVGVSSAWGWQLGPLGTGAYETPIYAGAGQNDITKGTHVGDLNVDYEGSEVTVTYDMFSGYTMKETHLYVGTVNTDTAAPGQYGNLRDLADVATDAYTITQAIGIDESDERALMSISGDIYLVAHAVVCSEAWPE
jgi:hypothetical protein